MLQKPSAPPLVEHESEACRFGHHQGMASASAVARHADMDSTSNEATRARAGSPDRLPRTSMQSIATSLGVLRYDTPFQVGVFQARLEVHACTHAGWVVQ
jgi:hypothetical protein